MSLTREQAVLKSINENVKIRPNTSTDGVFRHWHNWDSRDFRIADNWEAEPQQVTITLEQLEKAWDDFIYPATPYNKAASSEVFKSFKKELGFK